MWFDPRAKLAEILGHRPATSATTATQAPASCPVSQVSQVSQATQGQKPLFGVAIVASVATPPDPELIRDLLEERAAIREYDGGQSRAEAEAGALNDVSRSTGIAAVELSRLWQSHDLPAGGRA